MNEQIVKEIMVIDVSMINKLKLKLSMMKAIMYGIEFDEQDHKGHLMGLLSAVVKEYDPMEEEEAYEDLELLKRLEQMK